VSTYRYYSLLFPAWITTITITLSYAKCGLSGTTVECNAQCRGCSKGRAPTLLESGTPSLAHSITSAHPIGRLGTVLYFASWYTGVFHSLNQLLLKLKKSTASSIPTKSRWNAKVASRSILTIHLLNANGRPFLRSTYYTFLFRFDLRLSNFFKNQASRMWKVCEISAVDSNSDSLVTQIVQRQRHRAEIQQTTPVNIYISL